MNNIFGQKNIDPNILNINDNIDNELKNQYPPTKPKNNFSYNSDYNNIANYEFHHYHHNLIIIIIIYSFGIILWIYIIYYFKMLPSKDNIDFIIIIVPIFLFILAIFSSSGITPSVEQFMFRGNILSLGLVISLPLLSWVVDKYLGSDRKTFVQMMSIAIILSMITLVDIWVPEKYLYIVKHIKSILQTIAVFILMICLYRFLIHTDSNSLIDAYKKI